MIIGKRKVDRCVLRDEEMSIPEAFWATSVHGRNGTKVIQERRGVHLPKHLNAKSNIDQLGLIIRDVYEGLGEKIHL